MYVHFIMTLSISRVEKSMMDVCLFVLEIARCSLTVIVRISSSFVICIRKKDFAYSWQAPSVDLGSIKQI